MKRALVVVAGLCVAAASPRAELKLGEVVEDISFKAYDGKEYKLSDFRANGKSEGQVVVVYFNSEKCPAQISSDIIKKISDPWNDPKSGVKFLAFHAYGHDNEDRIKEFLAEKKFAFTSAWDADKKLRDHFGAKQVNHTFVLDRTGKLVYRGGLIEFKRGGEVAKETVVEAVKAAKEGKEAPKSDGRFAG
jgi:peroxiredoxin